MCFQLLCSRRVWTVCERIRKKNCPNLVVWWDVLTDDYFAHVENTAQEWARQAINRAAAPFVAAHNANPDRAPRIYEQVIGALKQMLDQVANMRLPPNNVKQNLQAHRGDG